MTLVVLIASSTALWSAQRGLVSPSDVSVRRGHQLFARVWTVNDGLGPLMNARSCVGCHAAGGTGGGGTDERSFVTVVPGLLGAPGRVFRRLRVSRTGAIDEEVPPINHASAAGQDFKTPPLWGIAKTGPPYLHDGRAKTLHDAIAAHGGEAEASANAYQKLHAVDRAAVLAFLRSL